ncbi:MAG: GGDEF domain-containing protein [Ilumatobacteraceae bacterium]
MKLVRLGALFGSIVLLVATSITMINKQSELRSDQDARVDAAAFVATQSALSTIERALAVVDVAAASPADSGATTDTSTDANADADWVDATLEALTKSFEGATACVVTSAVERCTGGTLLATDVYETALQASIEQGGAAAVVDEATDAVVVVASGANTVALQVPAGQLVTPEAAASIAALDASATVSVAEGGGAGVVGPETIDGQRVVTTSLPLGDGGGSVIVRSNVADDAGLFGENLALYAALLGLGTVLIALAGWTFLAERKSLERRATTDELTGLVNRREFERVTDEAILDAARFNTGLCVMLVDLNGFKQINDTLGHQFGDLVLQECAFRLTTAVRETDVVGRWGGDEFVILLPGLEDRTAVRRSAERIAAQLSSLPVVADVSISGAIGAALYPRHGEGLDDLVRAADVAMYEAKSSGVSHRIADSLSVDLAHETVSDSYIGPDRRRHVVSSDVDRVR